MKYLLYLSFLFVFVQSNNTFAQACSGDEMSTMKFVDGFPYGGTAFTLDYQDARVIKWNDSKISGTPIYLNNINVNDYIPFELLDETNNITSQYSQMINEWNSNYTLQLAINTNQDNIDVQFSDNPDLFDTGNPSTPAIGRTLIPVEETPFDGYKFHEHTDFGKTNDGTGFDLTDGVVYLNSADNQGFAWTTSTTPQYGEYMFGTIMLHELGHVLSMGHIENSYVNAIMKASYNPAAVTPSLKSCDKSNAAYHSNQLYNLVVGIFNGIDVTTYPSFLDENQQYSLNANFYKGDPYSTDHVLSWNWIIKLHYENGTYEYVNETFSGSSFWYSCPWTLNTTTLPTGYNWTLNTKGHIATDIILSAQIAGDGVSPITKIVSFNTVPNQPQNLTVVWYNNHPKLTWNTNLEDDISSYKVWKNAEGSSTIAATVTHDPSMNAHS